MLLHGPARREDDKVCDCRPSAVRRAGKHSKDGRVRVVERDRVDDHELGEVVFKGDVVAVPGDHVEGAVALFGLEQVALVLGGHRVVHAAVLVPRRRRQEVAGVCQAVGPYGPEVGQLEMAVEHFQDVAARRAAHGHGEAHALLNDADLIGGHVHAAELGDDVQRALLRHNEEVAVRVVEALVLHAGVARVHVHGEAVPGAGVSRPADRAQAVHPVGGGGGDVERPPAHLVGVRGVLVPVDGAEVLTAIGLHALEGVVNYRGPDAVQP